MSDEHPRCIGLLGDDWRWTGSRWRDLGLDPVPARRRQAAMATATDGEGVLLFGGRGGIRTFDDLWRTTADGWERLEPEVSPPPRTNAKMVLDDRRGRVVLFGGSPCDPAIQRCGDTWEWTGEEWLQRDVAGPPARAGHGMTYDAARGRTVLFGGGSEDEVCGAPGGRCVDLWEWDGARWQQRSPSRAPGSRSNPLLVWDPNHREVVLHAGYGCFPDAVCTDTWTWGPANLAPHLVAAFDLGATQTLAPSAADPSRRALGAVTLRAVGGGRGHTAGTGHADGDPVPGWRGSASAFGYGGWATVHADEAATLEAAVDWEQQFDADWRCAEADCAGAGIDRWTSADGKLYVDLSPLEAQGASADEGGVALDYLELRLRYWRTGCELPNERLPGGTPDGTACSDGRPETRDERCQAQRCVAP